MRHRGHSEAGNSFPVRVGEGRRVADHKELPMSRGAQVLHDQHSPGPVGLRTELFTEWRGGDSRRPEGDVCRDPFASDFDPPGLSRGYYAMLS